MNEFYFIINWVGGIEENASEWDFEDIMIIEANTVNEAIKKMDEWAVNEKVTIVDFKQMNRPFNIIK